MLGQRIEHHASCPALLFKSWALAYSAQTGSRSLQPDDFGLIRRKVNRDIKEVRNHPLESFQQYWARYGCRAREFQGLVPLEWIPGRGIRRVCAFRRTLVCMADGTSHQD